MTADHFLSWNEIFTELKKYLFKITDGYEHHGYSILESKACDRIWLILLNMFGNNDIGTSGDSMLYHALRLCDDYYYEKNGSLLSRVVLNLTSTYTVVVYSVKQIENVECIIHCIPISDYCTCEYFQKDIQKGCKPICFHLLAAHLIELSSF